MVRTGLGVLAVVAVAAVGSAQAADNFSAADQTALIHKHCAVCHTDAHLNGGLSLEHYDAMRAEPQLAAMLLSKITMGMKLEDLRAGSADKTILARMDKGAMRAAGRPLPDEATRLALVAALTAQSQGAENWSPVLTGDPANARTAVSMIREVPAAENGIVTFYRLTLSCASGTKDGKALLTWGNGVPDTGRAFSLASDAAAPVSQVLEAGEKDFPGAMGTTEVGGVYLAKSGALPSRTLTVRDVFKGDNVTFSFSGMDRDTRTSLTPCFKGP